MCTQCEEHDEERRNALRAIAGAGVALGFAANAAAETDADWDVRSSPMIISEAVQVPIEGGAIAGFLSRPRQARRRRTVLIMHGNPGIPDDITNTAAQLAIAGYTALAVDWTRDGQNWQALDKPALGAQQIAHARAGFEYLRHSPYVRRSRAGFVGFCGGGRTAFEAAAQGLPVACIVSFYGAAVTRSGGPLPTRDPATIVSEIHVPVQGHYGVIDEVAPASDAAPMFEALERSQRRSEFYAYENAGHRFYNMTAPAGSDPGYDFVPAAAALAHERMVRFLHRVLR